MSAFLIANMAPIMFASLVVVLLLGYPAAFSLGAVGLIYAFVGIQLGEFRPDFLQALPERVYGVMNNDTLLAIPFFTFMGLVLERSGMAEDLLDTIGQLFGTIRGGLAYAVVFVGALLAATTGVVANWCSGAIGPLTRVTVDLSSFAGSPVQLRWHEGDDESLQGTGWYVDSVGVSKVGVCGAGLSPAQATSPTPSPRIET